MQIKEGTYDQSQLRILRQMMEEVLDKSTLAREAFGDRLVEVTRTLDRVIVEIREAMEGEEGLGASEADVRIIREELAKNRYLGRDDELNRIDK